MCACWAGAACVFCEVEIKFTGCVADFDMLWGHMKPIAQPRLFSSCKGLKNAGLKNQTPATFKSFTGCKLRGCAIGPLFNIIKGTSAFDFTLFSKGNCTTSPAVGVEIRYFSKNTRFLPNFVFYGSENQLHNLGFLARVRRYYLGAKICNFVVFRDARGELQH